ncbi:MAG: hypothetical protein DRI97_06415 [Bacteroidetes bacterium]|nr:MAG: hypothetical protein DRI97_06415 [Bacteroidota bacterium]RLD72539.1 MAG: hypothetical protein DRI98_01695 [Bacteroidota bacterium]RLD94956.1 MAG: hypothetical protein DRJ29_04435 [Bacteroidota bacterium]
MNASDIIRLLNTNHYAPVDLDEVNKLCSDFPEFSTVHLLKVRIMEALGHEKQQQLKVAAIYSMNRKKLHQLVTEVKQSAEPEVEAEPLDENTEIIEFSEESNEHADVIIEQHAPYAGLEPDTELLELDEEPPEELLEILDEESEEPPVEDTAEETVEELVEKTVEETVEETVDEVSDELHSPLKKDEADMEEPKMEVDKMPEKGNNHLITSFISGESGPIRADLETSLKGDVSLASIREHDGFITDTLAQIYVKQGLYAKAIYAYEKLSLKYPEKSAYFAAQIEKIRNINHS